MHVVESNDKTVHLGVFDTTLEPILKVDSGDTISYVNTWTHFLNQMQPGVPVDFLAKQRLSNPERPTHSIIGPIHVNRAEPGDVLEIRYKRIRPFDWAAIFDNPGRSEPVCWPRISQMTGEVPEARPGNMTAEFNRAFTCRSSPSAGRWVWRPPMASIRRYLPGVTSSVPPGPHGGNVDLSEMVEGSTMFLPVWKPGALIFTGDSHAVQGDGEICLTALETRMKELRIQWCSTSRRTLPGRWRRLRPTGSRWAWTRTSTWP